MVNRNDSRALLVVSAVTVSGCCVALAGTQGLLWFYVGLEPDGTTAGPEPSALAARIGGAREINFTRTQALRTPTLWLLMAYTLLVFPVQAGVSLHLAPHLIERGISPTIAATIVSAFSLAGALSSVLFGYRE